MAAMLAVGGVVWFGAGREADAGGHSRRAAVAGRFYPGSRAALSREVSELLDSAPEPAAVGEVVAAVAPHAGYVFSGKVAAYTHRYLKGLRVDTVVIIGHDTHAKDIVAWLSDAADFETPLGKVAVDREMVAQLAASHDGIRVSERGHARDHTVEVQLPFLQGLGVDCKIVPVMFGEPTAENCRVFARAIEACSKDKRVFVLASTDLSHYPTYKAAREIDQSTLAQLPDLDVDELFAHLLVQEARTDIPNLQTAMCAKGGVGTAMLFAKGRGAADVRVLHYANSGDVAGSDRTRVVGYGAAIFARKAAEEDDTTEPPAEAAFTLPKAVQDEMLKLAR